MSMALSGFGRKLVIYGAETLVPHTCQRNADLVYLARGMRLLLSSRRLCSGIFAIVPVIPNARQTIMFWMASQETGDSELVQPKPIRIPR